MRRLILALAAFAFATPATAQVFTGTTTLSDPTYNRPLVGSPPSGLSLVGTAVHYQLLSFEVTASGSYDFLLHGDAPNNWDTFLGLYSGSFDPSSSLVNALIYSDDFPSIGLSGFTYNLLAGTSYFAVITGFANNDVGDWTLTIDGLGTAFTPGAVPEPAAWAMLIGGFGLAGAAMRRRAAKIAHA